MWRFISRLIAIACLFTSIHCKWNDPPATDTIVFALSSEPKSLDPRFATDAGGQRITPLIFSTLVKIGPDLQIVGDLAESWTYSDLTYTFRLRPQVYFHDGLPLTADDLLFSIGEFQKPRSLFAAQFSNIADAKATYDVNTGGELVFKLKEFSASFLNDLPSLKILPQNVVMKDSQNFYKVLVGSGPFQYGGEDIKNVLLVRNDNYYGTKAKSPKLQFKIIKDSNTRFQKMYKGQIDIIQSDVPFSKVRVFANSEQFNVIVQAGLSTTYLLLNLRDPQLQKKSVRQALNQSIQRDEIIRFSHEGFGETATAIITKVNPYHHAQMQSAPWTAEQSRAVVQALQGYKFIMKTSNTQEAIENGRILTHQLRAAGFNVEQQSYEWGTYYEDVRTGNFQIAVMKWVGITDPDIYRISLHSEMVPPGRNRGFYNNKEFDSLVSQAIREPDDKRRKDLYFKAQAHVYEDLPVIPLWYEKQVAITNKRVKDYSLPINGDFSSLVKVYKEK